MVSTQTRRRRALCVAGGLLAALAACAESAPGPGEDEPTPTSGSATPEPATTVEPADPDHAVDPPPPLDAPLVAADILVYDRDPLPRRVVTRLRRLGGVVAAERLALASVGIENRVFTIGAVDPATYRRFTLAGQHEETWARVAGGELALPEDLAETVATRDGYVQLGSDREAPKVHIGAYAPQAEAVDMVVNERWGEDLGMVPGNALLLNTGITAPLSLRKPIQRIVGDSASVQMLDAVARHGLDTSVKQTAIPTGGSVAQAVGSFSYRVAGGRVTPDPAWVAANIRTEEVPILGRVTCHQVMLPQLRGALQEVVDQGLADTVYQTAGCYYPRFIANTIRLSNHAFGIAIDINSRENQRGTVGQMDRRVVDIFKKWGFAWGGDWSWTDPMHFEMAALVEPG